MDEIKPGLPQQLRHSNPPMSCSDCAAGHTQKAAHRGKITTVPAEDTLADDIAGSMPAIPEGFKHKLVFTDIGTRFRLAYLLRKRSEATTAIMYETAAIARHFGQVPARLRVDNSNELLNKSI